MKKLILSIIVTLSLFQVSVVSFAASTAPVTVTSVASGAAGDIFVKTDGTFVSEGCTITTKYVVPNGLSAAKQLLAILLTAQASDKTVVLAVSGCQQVGPTQTYTKIFNVEVRN